MSGARMKYDELPDSVRRQVDRQLAGERQVKPEDIKPQIIAVKSQMRKMTKTERDFQAKLNAEYGRENVHFEALSFRLKNGHRYTPDFYVGTQRLCFEVKGSYRLQSYQRARLAFDQARVEFTDFVFIWMEQNKSGQKKQVTGNLCCLQKKNMMRQDKTKTFTKLP